MNFGSKDIFIPNGINVDENGMKDVVSKVNILAQFINSGQSILDLGCGNGLLLKILYEKLDRNIIPFGIDKNSDAIIQAKTILHPDFQKQFIQGDMMEFPFGNFRGFDLIICDFSWIKDRKLEEFLKQIEQHTSKICLFIYTDNISIGILKKRKKLQEFLFHKDLFQWNRKGSMLYAIYES